MGLGGFFKKFIGILPLIGKLLDNPIIKAILVTKLGANWIELISSLIDLADKLDISNREKHATVRENARNALASAMVGVSDSELDMLISGLVAKKRHPGTVEVVTK